jgi:hypothetical protein
MIQQAHAAADVVEGETAAAPAEPPKEPEKVFGEGIFD